MKIKIKIILLTWLLFSSHKSISSIPERSISDNIDIFLTTFITFFSLPLIFIKYKKGWSQFFRYYISPYFMLRNKKFYYKNQISEEIITINQIDTYQNQITEALEIINHAQKSHSNNLTGIIFEGPPRAGKTFLAKAISNISDMNIITIDITAITAACAESDFDEITSIVSLPFKQANNFSPSIIFIDECEKLFGNNYFGYFSDYIKNLLLSYMDQPLNKVVIIGTTSRIDLIDPAFLMPNRLGYQIKVLYPDYKQRKKIISKYLKKEKFLLAPDITIEYMIDNTNGLSAQEIKEILKKIRILNNTTITKQFFIESLPKSKLENVITIDQIGGYKEELAELLEIVNQAKNSDQTNVTGILLEGPPGTGKTYLAQAVAHETHVNVEVINTAEIFGKYVGETEKNITAMFEKARTKKPIIILIDECEALFGKKESDKYQWVTNAKNLLLSYMDGPYNMNGVILIGITNRKQMIDRAFLRPRRFEHIIKVPLPGYEDREDIIFKYLEQMQLKLDENIDIKHMAQKTEGLSTAEIAKLLKNIKTKKIQKITRSIFTEFFETTVMGKENKKIKLNKKEIKNIAVHESGHALLSYLYSKKEDNSYYIFDVVSINPRGDSLGANHLIARPDYKSMSKENIIELINISLSGRIAQVVAFSEANADTGASSDLEKAQSLAQLLLESHLIEASYQVTDKKSMQREINNIIKKQHKIVIEFFTQHKKLLEIISDELINRKTLYKDDMEKIIKKYENKYNITIHLP